MDIILPTRFNNPRLPVVVRQGFHDNFDRPPAGTLGTTGDGKPWNHFGFTPWKIVSPGHATGLGTSNHAVVDGMTPNGTLTTVVGRAASEGADKRAGLVFRMLDRDNYLYVCPNTANTLTLYGRIGATTAISQAINGVTLATADTLAVTMDGEQVTVSVNRVQVATRAIPELSGETLHGFYGHTSSDAEWGSIEFTPA